MKKVLVVDDEPSILTLLTFNLEKEGYQVTTSEDGKNGFELALSNQYDFIILDVMLPGMDGLEITKALRREKIDTPILILTAKDEQVDKIIGLEIGADDYLTKPFNNKELSARVEVQLRNLNQSPPQNLLVWKELSIDKSTRNVYLNKNKIELTNKEYDILCLLMKTPEKPISKQKIYEKIQGLYLGDDNTVNVHVSNIRKKLSTYTNRSYIKTVWGIGFIIE